MPQAAATRVATSRATAVEATAASRVEEATKVCPHPPWLSPSADPSEQRHAVVA